MRRRVTPLLGLPLLAACSLPGIAIPAGSDELLNCDLPTIEVEELTEPRDCDLSGASIRLPDGSSTVAPTIGGASLLEVDQTRAEVTTMNLGAMGTLVALRDDGDGLRVWGTPEAIVAYMDDYSAPPDRD